MKYFLTLLIILSSLLVNVALSAETNPAIPTPSLSGTQQLDTIVAVVNNQIITQEQLNQAVGQAEQEMQTAGVPIPNETALRSQVLNQLINQTLQLQIAKRMSIQVSDDQLNQAILSIAKRNNLSLSQFREMLIQKGIDYAAYRKQIRDQMIISQVQQQVVGGQVNVTDQAVKEFLQNYKQQKHADTQYHVHDILISLPNSPNSKQLIAAKEKAKRIVKQLKQGANFEQLAAAHSAGQQALQGGDLGWNTLGGLPDIFAKRLITMEPGQIAGPIRAANGFHILKLVAIRSNTNQLTPANIKQIIYQRNYNQALQSWLEELRDNAYIKIMPTQ